MNNSGYVDKSTCKEKVATPEITLDGAQATITCTTSGATILYEIADSEPASFTKTYTSAVTLTDGQTIWAKATKEGVLDSKVVSKKYTVTGATSVYKKVASFSIGKKYILVVNSYNKIFDGSNVSETTTAVDASSLISNDEIESNETTDAYAVTIESSTTTGKYLIKLNSEKYLVINALTSSNGKLSSADTGEAITIKSDSGGFQLISTNRSTRGVCYRDGYQFKNYAVSNFSSSGYSGTFTLYEYTN